MLTLAAIGAAFASISVAVSPVSAETSTQLCKVHTSLVCPVEDATTVDHLVNTEPVKLLSSLATILCLNRLEENTPLGLGNPQTIHTLVLEYTGCGTNSAHTNCTTETQEEPLWHLLKTGLDSGIETALNGLLHTVCNEVSIFKLKIDCVYDMTGIEVTVGGQHVTAEKTPVKFVEGAGLCPENTTLDYLLETLEPTYVLE
jgi:hypothetical protein